MQRWTPSWAGSLYFGLIFCVGFVFGTARTIILAGLPGDHRMLAVLVEVPVILAASWLACGFVVRRLDVASTRSARLLMGTSAFALLMIAETLLDVLLFKRSLAAHIAQYREASQIVGLAAQMIFAAMPLWVARRPALAR